MGPENQPENKSLPEDSLGERSSGSVGRPEDLGEISGIIFQLSLDQLSNLKPRKTVPDVLDTTNLSKLFSIEQQFLIPKPEKRMNIGDFGEIVIPKKGIVENLYKMSFEKDDLFFEPKINVDEFITQADRVIIGLTAKGSDYPWLPGVLQRVREIPVAYQISAQGERVPTPIDQGYGIDLTTDMGKMWTVKRARIIDRRYGDFFEAIKSRQIGASCQILTAALELIEQGGNIGGISRLIDPESKFDNRIHDLDDPLTVLIDAILNDNELHSIWKKQMDQVETAETDVFLRKFARTRETLIGKIPLMDTLIIGGGIVTGPIVDLLNVFGEVAVVTNAEKIGGPGLNRVLATNSTFTEEDSTAPRLPLQKGTTSPTSFRRYGTPDPVSLDLVLKEVSCASGEKRVYPTFKAWAEAVRTTIHTQADYLATKIEIDVEEIKYVDVNGGCYLIPFTDLVTGQLGFVRAKNVIVATGTGGEKLVEDTNTRYIFEDGVKKLDQDIQNALNQLRSGVKVETPQLPRILTQSVIEKLYAFWEETGFSDETFPFWPLFDNSVVVGQVGLGDQGRITSSFVGHHGLRAQFPKIFDFGNKDLLPKMEIYGVELNKNGELPSQRPRYDADLRKAIELTQARLFSNSFNGVTQTSPGGSLNVKLLGFDVQSRQVDYLFINTGVKSAKREFKYLNVDKVQGGGDGYVGLGDEFGGLVVVGVADGLTAKDYDTTTAENIRTVRARENSAALWVKVAQTLELLGIYLANRLFYINNDVVEDLLYQVSQDK